MHERMVDEMDRHASHYTKECACEIGGRRAALSWRVPPRSRPRRPVVAASSSAGTVITENVQSARSFARRRRDRRHRYRGRRSAGGDCRAYRAARHHRRARSNRPARPGQYPHPRADGHVSRSGRRPRADGVAAEIHLSRRSQDRLARDGADRDASGGARDDRVGHDDLHRHVLLRGGNRPRDAAKRACAASSARRSSSFRSPTRRRRPTAWPAPNASSRNSRATR